MYKIYKKQSAFGLIETILASGILIVVVGALALISSVVLKSSRQTSEDLMANYLIYDVFESARQIRGTNYIDEDPNTSWDNGLVAGNKKLNFTDPLKPIFVDDVSGNGENLPLKRNIVYTRKINLEKIPTDKIKITVTILWGSGKQRKSAIILTNYEQGF